MSLINYSYLNITISAINDLLAYNAKMVLSYISYLSIDINATTS
jgi:hypothetical protein